MSRPCPPLYDKVGDSALDRVDNRPLEIPGRAVCTVDMGSDRVLRWLGHVRPPLSRWAHGGALRGDHLASPFLLESLRRVLAEVSLQVGEVPLGGAQFGFGVAEPCLLLLDSLHDP